MQGIQNTGRGETGADTERDSVSDEWFSSQRRSLMSSMQKCARGWEMCRRCFVKPLMELKDERMLAADRRTGCEQGV